MAIANVEREVFGAPLTVPERVVAGLLALLGAAGHALLGAAAVTFVYALVTAL